MRHVIRPIPLRRNAQEGAILVVSVIFVLILLVLGGSAVSTVILEERMASNMRNKNASFQAAEAALAVAENYLNSTGTLTDTGGTYPLASGRLPAGDPGQGSYWTSFDWANASNATSITVNILGGNRNAFYVIQEINVPASTRGVDEGYRITTYAPGATSGTSTYLQAYYTR